MPFYIFHFTTTFSANICYVYILAEFFEKININLYFCIGTFKGLSQIHKYLFEDIYDFAGKLRTVNITKSAPLAVY